MTGRKDWDIKKYRHDGLPALWIVMDVWDMPEQKVLDVVRCHKHFRGEPGDIVLLQRDAAFGMVQDIGPEDMFVVEACERGKKTEFKCMAEIDANARVDWSENDGPTIVFSQPSLVD